MFCHGRCHRSVRVSVDQRTLNDWNEIDAVKLIGNP